MNDGRPPTPLDYAVTEKERAEGMRVKFVVKALMAGIGLVICLAVVSVMLMLVSGIIPPSLMITVTNKSSANISSGTITIRSQTLQIKPLAPKQSVKISSRLYDPGEMFLEVQRADGSRDKTSIMHADEDSVHSPISIEINDHGAAKGR